jgi:hypothetical protein
LYAFGSVAVPTLFVTVTLFSPVELAPVVPVMVVELS